MPKTSRWTAEKRDEIVLEMLRRKESIAQIARRHRVPDALLHRWRERFFEGGTAAAFRNDSFLCSLRKEIFKYQVALIQFSWVSMASARINRRQLFPVGEDPHELVR